MVFLKCITQQHPGCSFLLNHAELIGLFQLLAAIGEPTIFMWNPFIDVVILLWPLKAQDVTHMNTMRQEAVI